MILQIVKLVIDSLCVVGLSVTIYLLLKHGDKLFRVDGVKVFGNDTAHIGPWTTVRACLDCGVLIVGGPSRCTYCANEIAARVKNLEKAT